MDINECNISPSEDSICVYDKGTLDAFLLNEQNSVDTYKSTICKLTENANNKMFIITSCNHSQPELISMFEEFTVVDVVNNYPSFSFGGSSGSNLATVLFKIS